MRLADRLIVVTGGSRGLGRAIAIEAGREGARVIVGYRNRERDAREVVAAAVEAGAREADVARLDVRDAPGVEAAIAEIRARHGDVDGLVCSAGIVSDAFVATHPLEPWDDVITTNLRGTMIATRAVLRGMIARKQGAIVALASVSAMRASPGQAAYSASKAGILALVRTLAAEVAAAGIRVNAIAPGVIDAGMVRATSRERMREVDARIPMGRRGRAEDVGRGAVFLLSEDAAYVTGHTLVIDGGLGL